MHKQWKPVSKSMSMRFLVVLSVSGFHFGSKFSRHSSSVNSVISKVFFPSTSYIFDFTIATIFARDSRQQYHFMHKCNSTLNTLPSVYHKLCDSRVNPDTFGCVWTGDCDLNTWTGKFLNTERKSCRFKNIRIRADRDLS